MENSDNEGPDKKRPHLTSVSSRTARNATNSSPNNKTVIPFLFLFNGYVIMFIYADFNSSIDYLCSVDDFVLNFGVCIGFGV